MKERQRKLEATTPGPRGSVLGLCFVVGFGLLAGGCNLLRSAAIDRTCEDLPGGCGSGDTDSGLSGTGVTGPMGVAATEWGGSSVVLVADGGAGAWNAHVELPISGTSRADGPLVFDPAGATFWYFDRDGGQLHDAGIDGGDTTFTPPVSAEGLAFQGGSLYFAAGDTFGWFDAGSGSFNPVVVEEGLTDLVSVFQASETELYLLDRGSSDVEPSLLTYDTERSEVSMSARGFLSGPTLGIAQGGFTGPSLQPYICSSAGAVFDVQSLADGNSSPVTVPDPESLQALTGQNIDALGDVADCGYDAWSKRFLLLSRTWGVLYLDALGQVEIRLSPEPGTMLLRGAFFE